MHEESEEFYLLLKGSLWLLVAESLVSLKPNEILMVKAQVPHAIVKGVGRIEHFGLRAPAPDDRCPVAELTRELPPASEETRRELNHTWGYRIPLQEPRNQNCWLIGAGSARFPSQHLILAYLNFPTVEAANAGIGTRHRLHLHKRSWEYYVVIEGTVTLKIEAEKVAIRSGEILEVPPGVRHTLQGRQVPYQGFTLRVPVELNDKVEYL